IELKYRQQLDRRDTELLEVGNSFDQTRVSAPRLLADPRAGMSGETADMHLVHDGPRGWPAQRFVPFPIVGARVHHHALHRRCSVVAFRFGGGAAVVFWNHDGAPVRIKQELAVIKARTARGIEWSIDSKTVD